MNTNKPRTYRCLVSTIILWSSNMYKIILNSVFQFSFSWIESFEEFTFLNIWCKIIFCYQNCSDLLWEKIALVIKRNLIRDWRSRIFKMFEITWTIYSSSERSEQTLVTECLLTCWWRLLRSNTLKQLQFKMEKNIGI